MSGTVRCVARRIRAAMIFAACLGTATVVQASFLGSDDPKEAGLFGIYARLSLELATRFQADEPVPDTRIVLGPGGRDIRLAGELSEGAAERLRKLLAMNPQVERIHLTSEGGLVDEGEAIGALIAARGLVTYVPDYCVSACTLAFVRGRERLMVGAGRLGFHGPYEVGLFGQVFRADGTPERAAYLAAGLAPDFVDAALKVASEDLWLPDVDRLIAAGVLTGIVDTRRFPDSTLDEGDDAEHARAAILRNLHLLRAFEKAAPHVLDDAASWYLAGYRSGLSEGEAVGSLKRVAARAVSRAMRGADEATLVAFGHHLLRAMNEARTADPAVCAAIGAEANLVLAQEILGERTEAAALRLVERAVGKSRSAIAKISTVADDAQRPMSAPSAGECAGARRAYGEALAKPGHDAALALRALLDRSTVPPTALEASAAP